MCKHYNSKNRKIFVKNRYTVIFKRLNKEEISKEILCVKLAQLLRINTVNQIKNYKNKGVIIRYLPNSKTLYKTKKLTNKQIKELKKIILFDIWIGNKDRHSANILLFRNKLIAIDHTKVLHLNETAIKYIKLDVGRRIDKDYVEKIEQILNKHEQLNLKYALCRYFGFNYSYFRYIKNIKDEDINKIVNENKLITNKIQVINILIERKRNIQNLNFV